jgi:hypothetical protein
MKCSLWSYFNHCSTLPRRYREIYGRSRSRGNCLISMRAERDGRTNSRRPGGALFILECGTDHFDHVEMSLKERIQARSYPKLDTQLRLGDFNRAIDQLKQ